jgi:hypothetical protein
VQRPKGCVSCNDEDEDGAHVFFHCHFVVQVWQIAGLGDDVGVAIHNNITVEDVVFALFYKLTDDLKQRMAVVLWSLWKHRNLKLWQNEQELLCSCC